MTAPLSGTAVSLRCGDYAAEIASVGASLRSLTHGGRDLVVPYRADEVRPLFRGAVLAPWPNRVIDGRYAFSGVPQVLALTEPERGHALHGLMVWTDYRVVASSGDTALLEAELPAQAGYPHRLVVRVEYRLGEDGLTTTVAVENTGPSPAPWGTAAHPYLVAGPGRVDDWTVEVPAERVVEVEPDRLLPIGVAAVSGDLDLRGGVRIGDRFVDHAYTGLAFADGRTAARVIAADGRGVEMEWDERAPWVQVHTGDRPEPELDRIGLAVEPMTCPPDAFNSGEDLVVLAPGGSHEVAWAIRAI